MHLEASCFACPLVVGCRKRGCRGVSGTKSSHMLCLDKVKITLGHKFPRSCLSPNPTAALPPPASHLTAKSVTNLADPVTFGKPAICVQSQAGIRDLECRGEWELTC